MASMVRAKAARGRSISDTSASWLAGLASVSAISCSVSVLQQSPRPFGIKGSLCQVHHNLYITRLPGEPFRPGGQRDAAADQPAEPGRVGPGQRLDRLLVVAPR